MLHKPGDRVAYKRFAQGFEHNAKPGDPLIETGTVDRDSIQGGTHFWWVKPDGPTGTAEGDGTSRLARDLRQDWELMHIEEVQHAIQSR